MTSLSCTTCGCSSCMWFMISRIECFFSPSVLRRRPRGDVRGRAARQGRPSAGRACRRDVGCAAFAAHAAPGARRRGAQAAERHVSNMCETFPWAPWAAPWPARPLPPPQLPLHSWRPPCWPARCEQPPRTPDRHILALHKLDGHRLLRLLVLCQHHKAKRALRRGRWGVPLARGCARTRCAGRRGCARGAGRRDVAAGGHQASIRAAQAPSGMARRRCRAPARLPAPPITLFICFTVWKRGWPASGSF